MSTSIFPIFCLIAAGCYSANSALTIKGASSVDCLLRTAGSVVDDGVVVVEQLTLPEDGNKQKSTPTEPKDNESNKAVIFLDDSAIKLVDTAMDSKSGRARRVRRSPIEERVKKIIAEQLGVKEEEVVPSANFVDDLGADSLDTVELIMALEEEFDIEIPDEEAEKLTTVQSVIDYVQNQSE